MSRFFVGQRVRVVAAHDRFGMRAVGFAGVVNEIDCVGGRGTKGMIGVTLPILSPIHGGHEEWCFLPSELEPILPGGHQAGDFANVHDLLDSLKRTQRNPDEAAA